jgi:hypothetical protein
VNAIEAVRLYLAAAPAVAALIEGRAWGGEVPRSENASMPRAALVVSRAGGGTIGATTTAYGDVRVDVDCYGASPYEADQLYVAVERALKSLAGAVHDEVRLSWAKPSAAGVHGRDPDAGWPMVVSSWQVLAKS